MPADPTPPAAGRDTLLRRLVAVLVVIFVAAALKATKPVTMPLAFALFFVILFWPLYRRLDRALPKGVALLATFFALLAVLGLFVGALWFAVGEVAEKAPSYQEEVQRMQAQASSFFGALDGGGGDEASGGAPLSGSRIVGLAERVFMSVWSLLGYLVLVLALFVLAMGEVKGWKRKLRDRFDAPISRDSIDTAEKVTAQVQRFLLVQSFTAVITGVLTALVTWLLGLDFWFVWGLVALILNFIPTLGSIVSVSLPTAFALLQFGVGWQVFVLFGALCVIELVLGAYVDPKLQGRYLQLSAFVILVAITFWGWVWGIPGAFIATPITAAAVLAARHGEGTEWVARLLSRADDEGEAPGSTGRRS